MKNLNEQISRIKDMMRQINEIEKYVPSIDSPEDEEEVENLYGHVYGDDDDDDETGYDPYKETDPFKTLKSNDFYDDKLITTNYKERPKNISNTPGNFKMTQSDGESGNNYFIDPYFEQDGKYIWNTDERKIDNIKNNIESIENAIDHLKERYNEFKENGEDFAKLSRIKDKIQTHEEKLIMYKDFLSQYS
jgi:uncharacterized protein with HEPN domain